MEQAQWAKDHEQVGEWAFAHQPQPKPPHSLPISHRDHLGLEEEHGVRFLGGFLAADAATGFFENELLIKRSWIMPGMDGRGPLGTGPIGRGLGPCGAGITGWGRGRGFWGARFGPVAVSLPNEKEWLEQQKNWLSSQLASIEQQLQEVEENNSKSE